MAPWPSSTRTPAGPRLLAAARSASASTLAANACVATEASASAADSADVRSLRRFRSVLLAGETPGLGFGLDWPSPPVRDGRFFDPGGEGSERSASTSMADAGDRSDAIGAACRSKRCGVRSAWRGLGLRRALWLSRGVDSVCWVMEAGTPVSALDLPLRGLDVYHDAPVRLLVRCRNLSRT
jgi:hypothetical protein